MGLVSTKGFLKLIGTCCCNFLVELFLGNLSLWRSGLTDLKILRYSTHSWQLRSLKDYRQFLKSSHLVFEWVWPEQLLAIDFAAFHYCLQTMRTR